MPRPAKGSTKIPPRHDKWPFKVPKLPPKDATIAPPPPGKSPYWPFKDPETIRQAAKAKAEKRERREAREPWNHEFDIRTGLTIENNQVTSSGESLIVRAMCEEFPLGRLFVGEAFAFKYDIRKYKRLRKIVQDSKSFEFDRALENGVLKIFVKRLK